MKTTLPTPKAQDGASADSTEDDADDLDRSSEITDRDVKLAVRSWKELAPERYKGLVDAGEYKGK